MLLTSDIERIVSRYNYEDLALMSILAEIQDAMGFLPSYALRAVADCLEIPLSRVFALCSFYDKYGAKEGAKHTIAVCTGTSCDMSDDLLGIIKDELHIEPGQTTGNKMFGLETVRCLGCCARAPVVMCDGVIVTHADKALVLHSLTTMMERK